eukprot:746718-Hanusia_phi.AAC.1
MRAFSKDVFVCALGQGIIASKEYLQSTKIPTFHFQDSLPRLPIPELKDTSNRFLESAKPLVTPQELNVTQKLLNEFVGGKGKQLQEAIVAREKKRYSSFITEPWFDMYLENRSPLPLNINPQLTLLDDPLLDKNDQASRAALLTWSSARFFRTLTEGHLIPDMFHTQKCLGGTGTGFFKFLNGKGGSSQFETVCAMTPRNYAFYAAYIYGTYPLDMSQYQNLFQSTRVPMPGKDKLVKYETSKHVVIQRGTEFWSLDILDDNGNVISADQILSAMQHILSTPVKYDDPSVGILTATDRNEWATARSKLIESSSNAESLQTIDSAMFAICLEDHIPTDYVDQQNSFLHGSAKNRWFDKSFQMIIQPKWPSRSSCPVDDLRSSGRAGINFEHSWGDGVAVLRYFNEVKTHIEMSWVAYSLDLRQQIYDDSSKAPCPKPQTHPKGPRKLEFKISNEVQAIIDKAEKDFNNTRSSVATHLLEVPGHIRWFLRLGSELVCRFHIIVHLAEGAGAGRNASDVISACVLQGRSFHFMGKFSDWPSSSVIRLRPMRVQINRRSSTGGS